MARTDYEAAWIELGDRLRAKPGWGAKELHELMAEVVAKHRLPENFVQQVVRLYGDSIHLSITTETGTPALDASETTIESKPPDPAASTAQQGGHDEQQDRRARENPRGTGRERLPAGAR